MAELPVIENTSRVTFKWGPLVVANVMHFHQTDPSVSGLFGAINTHLDARMWSGIVNSQRVTEVDITPLDGSAGTQTFIPPTVVKWQGQENGESIPAGAIVLSKHTALRGRSARGRSFLGPVAEASQANGTLTGTKAADVAAGWAAFGSAMIVDGAQEVVASYKLSSALTVINWSVRNVLGTMRLRQSRLAHS